MALFVLASCDVYDPNLLRFEGRTQAGMTGQNPRDAGDDRDSATDDGGQELEPTCVEQSDPDCPVRCREVCNGRDDDCDDLIDEGGSENLCPLKAATAVCAEGRCLIAGCDEGHVDCNEVAADGCEDTLDTVDSCGSCTRRCSLANAVQACRSGRCAIASCQRGFDDCDKRTDNGCERELTALTDCGACGKTCSAAHAVTDCGSSTCKFLRCSPGWGDCNQDAAKLAAGDGCETDLSKPAQCGQCGLACPTSAPFCSGGKCTAIDCADDLADCDADNKTCETDLRTVQNCGSCGAACGGAPNAAVGCSTTGSCALFCNDGWRSCDESAANGCETNIRTDNNCGECARSCSFANGNTTCGTTGACALASCVAGYGNCNSSDGDGCEQRLNTLQHCGGCGNPCALPAHAQATCPSGSCQLGTCDGGWGNCDGNAANGCETNTTNSGAHCGGCNKACASGLVCQNGSCVCQTDANCPSGQTCCGGSCADLRSDETHCGACTTACGSGQTCCSSSCKSLASDIKNCGQCGNACGDDTNQCSGGNCRCSSDGPCGGLDRCCSNGCRPFICF